MAPLGVHEWLLYMPIFVDFSEIKRFSSWLESEEATNAVSMDSITRSSVLGNIKSLQSEAWISPIYSTHVATLGGNLNGVKFEVQISFRLRTLCLEIRGWKNRKSGMQVDQAFKEMKEFEEAFKNYIERWGTLAPVCNVLVLRPFPKTRKEVESWLMNHNEDLDIFPIICPIGSGFTLCRSRLLEKDEPLPFLVTNIRDNKGVQRRVIMLCSERKPSGEPSSRSRTRWIFFSSLLQHVTDRINKTASSVAEEISKLEAQVIELSPKLSKAKGKKRLTKMLDSALVFSRELTMSENELAVALDDLSQVRKDLHLIERVAGGGGLTDDKPVETVICGNADFVESPEGIMGFGIFRGIDREELRAKSLLCSSSYYCALCDAKTGKLSLTAESPLNEGVMQQAKRLIDISIVNFVRSESEIMKSLNRTKSFVSSLSSILSTQVNLSLDLSLSRTAIDQKEVLSKMETLLEEAKIDRRVSEKAAKAVEVLSLLFASFVLGEISSNFIVLWLQQVWQVQIPSYAYFGGFVLAISIAGMIFILMYYGYLKPKWKRRPRTSVESARATGKRAYQRFAEKLDVETQMKYPKDLLDKYVRQYPHNPEGVLEWHIHKKMKEGKTREQAIKELLHA